MSKVIRTFRKGAYVRYIGNDPKHRELLTGIYQVHEKTHHMIVGCFPYKEVNGRKYFDTYAMPLSDFEIVISTQNGWETVKKESE